MYHLAWPPLMGATHHSKEKPFQIRNGAEINAPCQLRPEEGLATRIRIQNRVARFFMIQQNKTGKNIPNRGKMYQMAGKFLPNGHKIHKYQYLPLQDSPQITQIGIFGLKMCHLATLIQKLGRKLRYRKFRVTKRPKLPLYLITKVTIHWE
jgi:hypothetical protein